MKYDNGLKKILLIDDDVDQTAMYKHPFEKSGFDVSVENKPLNAVAGAIGWKPDLILLDIVMEDMDGVEVLRKLKENKHTKDIPVVMLTNTYDKKIVDEVKTIGASDYWEKTKMMPSDIVRKSKKLLNMA